MGKNFKILIIDDEVSLEKIYVTFLRNVGADIEFFDHPQKGWKAIDSNSYDLIITDLKMPIISGDEFISIVRSSRLNAHTPIILSSAFIDRPVMADLSRQSKVYFLKKPFDSHALLELVSKVTGVKSKGQKGNSSLWENFKSSFVQQLEGHKIGINEVIELEDDGPWNVESVLVSFSIFDDNNNLNVSLLLKTKSFLDLAGHVQGTHYSELESESFLIWDQLISKCMKNTGRVSYCKVIGHQFIFPRPDKKPLVLFKTEFGEVLFASA